jgi:hypothetical protein
MTREEEIKKAAKEIAQGIEDWELAADIEDAFIEGAWWADSHPHWISVEDEMPKETNMYIVVHYNVVCTMWWYDGVEEWAEIYVDENEDIQSRRMENITHWMPLPQPPKEGGEG